MQRKWRNLGLLLVFFSLAWLLAWVPAALAKDGGRIAGQQPTVAIPTVTGTATRPIAVIYSDPEDQINVRSGPSTDYPKIGLLLKCKMVC